VRRLQQRQAAVKPSREALHPEHGRARRGELDRQRQAVEPPANLGDQRSVGIGQREVVDDRGHTLDEQLHRRESRRIGGRQFRRRLRAAERTEAVVAFTRYPKRLAAGRQDADAWRSAENCRRQARSRVNDMLAIAEQQQHPLVSEGSDQAGKRVFGANSKAEHGGDRARHQARVA
jgi:hypothetical protein